MIWRSVDWRVVITRDEWNKHILYLVLRLQRDIPGGPEKNQGGMLAVIRTGYSKAELSCYIPLMPFKDLQMC